MSDTPALDGRRLVRTLERAGFRVLRVRGSHHFLRHPDGRSTVVPVHGGETVGKGLFRKILKDCEMSSEELMELL